MHVVIIGAGGHGRVVLDIVRATGRYTPAGFIDADAARAGSTFAGLPVFGPIHLLPRLLKQQNVTHAIVAIGDNRARARYAELVRANGMELASAIHPSAVVSPNAVLGRNICVCPNAVIQTDARIGDSAIINTAAVVEHECVLGEAVHVAPGALLAGRVEVGDGAFLGLGARVIPCMKIGAHATVGAGAVVIEDVPPDATVVGVPARKI